MSHYYANTPNGVVPRHFVPLVSRPDELRPTTLRDVRKMWKDGDKVVPSVTTILGILDKPALTNWYIDEHLDVAFDCERKYGKDIWLKKVKADTKKKLEKAPELGTDFHASIEAYFQGQLPEDHPDRKLCKSVASHISQETGVYFWNCERNFVNEVAGYGGQVDLSTKEGDHWILDFKTKETADKFKPGKMVWESHGMQLASYRKGIGMPDARCANIFVSLEDGQIDFHEHKEEDLEYGWNLFESILRVWHVKNRSIWS